MKYLLKQPKLSFSFIIESHHQQDCLKFQWAAIEFYELQLLIPSRSWKYIIYLCSLLQALCFPRIPIYTWEAWIVAILSILDCHFYKSGSFNIVYHSKSDPILYTKNDLYISKVTFVEQREEKCVPLFLSIFQSYTALRIHSIRI